MSISESRSNAVKAQQEKPFDLCERTRQFALRIIRLCLALEKKSGVVRTLGGQVLQSGTSIGANVEEGQGGQSRRDFIAKYSIARKEGRETRYWLRLLMESGVMGRASIQPLYQECEEIVKILTSIIKKAGQAKE